MAVGQDGNYTLKRFLVLLIPVIVLLGWLFARGPGPAEVPFTRVVRETIVSTLNTNGKVEPIEWAAAHAEVGGPIQQIHVQRGQTVRKGQVLVTISLPDVQSDLSAAEARINAARAEIETLNLGGRAVTRPKYRAASSGRNPTWPTRRTNTQRCNVWPPRMPRPRRTLRPRGRRSNAPSSRSSHSSGGDRRLSRNPTSLPRKPGCRKRKAVRPRRRSVSRALRSRAR